MRLAQLNRTIRRFMSKGYSYLGHRLTHDRVEVMTKRSGWSWRSIYRCSLCEKRYARVQPRKECEGAEAGAKFRKRHGAKLSKQIDTILDNYHKRVAFWQTQNGSK